MNTKRPRILLAEDDLHLGFLIESFLESEGFEVKLCKDGELAIHAFQHYTFDLCLLDVMMPKIDGFTVAKTIRETNKSIPVIFITAKSLKEDKMKGYALQADDYITKPFDEEELLWKIKAIIRRTSSIEHNTPILNTIQIGSFIFDFQNQSLSLNNDVKRITEKECEVLKYLALQPNKVIKREVMLKDLWGENDYFMGRSLDVFITKIRKYLKEDPHVSIENVFGVGFILNVPSN